MKECLILRPKQPLSRLVFVWWTCLACLLGFFSQVSAETPIAEQDVSPTLVVVLSVDQLMG